MSKDTYLKKALLALISKKERYSIIIKFVLEDDICRLTLNSICSLMKAIYGYNRRRAREKLYLSRNQVWFGTMKMFAA